MSRLSRRVNRVWLAALAAVALVVVTAISGSAAAPKTFTFTVSPPTVTANTADQTFDVKVTNTTASATINSFSVTLPSQFVVLNPPAPTISSSNNGNNSGAVFSTDPSANTASVQFLAPLNRNNFVTLRIHASVVGAPCGTTSSSPWTVSPWTGSQIGSGQPFTTSQPAVRTQITKSCGLGPGDSITDPETGQTETISGFGGHVNVTFGGNLDCRTDPTFGSQWLQFHLPTQVNITPGDGFEAVSTKISTSKFTPATGADSSSYLICYGVPRADHDAFATRGGGFATEQDVDGTPSWVGILPNCYDPISGLTRPEPCVSEQFLDLTTNKIVISVRMPAGDPYKR